MNDEQKIKTCLECTLPFSACDDKKGPCPFVQITRMPSEAPEMQRIYSRRSYKKHAETRKAAKRAQTARKRATRERQRNKAYARAESMTPERRKEIAKQAANARWAKQKEERRASGR